MEELLQPDTLYAQILETYGESFGELKPENFDEYKKLLESRRFFKFKEWQEPFAWLKRAAVNLVKRGIIWTDATERNIMKRPTGEHVLIDFGHNTTAPRKRIPMASFNANESSDVRTLLLAKQLISIAKSLAEEGPELPEIGHITCHCGHHWDIEVDDEEPLVCHECGCDLFELKEPVIHDETDEEQLEKD